MDYNDYIYVIYIDETVNTEGNYDCRNSVVPRYFKSIDDAKKFMGDRIPNIEWEDYGDMSVSDALYYLNYLASGDEVNHTQRFKIERMYAYGGKS